MSKQILSGKWIHPFRGEMIYVVWANNDEGSLEVCLSFFRVLKIYKLMVALMYCFLSRHGTYCPQRKISEDFIEVSKFLKSFEIHFKQPQKYSSLHF